VCQFDIYTHTLSKICVCSFDTHTHTHILAHTYTHTIHTEQALYMLFVSHTHVRTHTTHAEQVLKLITEQDAVCEEGTDKDMQ